MKPTSASNSKLGKFKLIRSNLKNLKFKKLDVRFFKFECINLKNPEVRKVFKKKFVRHVGKVTVTCLSLVAVATLSSATAAALDNSTIIVNSEAGKSVLNEALKVTRSKPALSVAAVITCVACIPVAGVVASPAMCVACGILIAKVIG
jgi:hypothetical protein